MCPSRVSSVLGKVLQLAASFASTHAPMNQVRLSGRHIVNAVATLRSVDPTQKVVQSNEGFSSPVLRPITHLRQPTKPNPNTAENMMIKIMAPIFIGVP